MNKDVIKVINTFTTMPAIVKSLEIKSMISVTNPSRSNKFWTFTNLVIGPSKYVVDGFGNNLACGKDGTT